MQGEVPLDLAAQERTTQAVWWTVPDEVWSAAGWEVRPLGGRRTPAQRRVLTPTAVPA